VRNLCASIALAFFTRVSSPAFAGSDGGFIDELDVSGPFTRRLAADGLSAHLSGKCPGLVFAMAAADEKAFEDVGLPK
jgi:hypothetical protein